MKAFQNTILIIYLVTLFLTSSIFTKKKKKSKKSGSKNRNFTVVKELNETAFNEYNSTHNIYFLMFYAPWCGICKKLLPIYDKAAIKANKLGWKVDFAMINSMTNKGISKKWGVNSYPTIFWINNDEHEKIEYESARSILGFMRYINSSLNFTTEELSNFESLEQKLKNGNHLVFVGDHELHWENYKKIVKYSKGEIIDFIYWTKSDDFFLKFNIDRRGFDAVIFNVKNKILTSGNRFNLSKNVTKEEVQKMIEIYTRKIWGQANEYTLSSAVEKNTPTPTIFILYDENQSMHTEFSQELDTLANKYRTELWILNNTYQSKFSNIFTEVFNITNQLPYVILVNDNINNEDDVDKYVMNPLNRLTGDSIEQFYLDFKNGKLNKFLFSQNIPETPQDENGIVRVVGHTYNELVVNNTGKDVVLFLCVFLSKRCQAARERFARVAQKLKDNKNIMFADIDSVFNEFTHIKYKKLPLIALFPGYDIVEERINNVKLYNGKFYTNNIVEWIKLTVKFPVENVEKLESEILILKQESKKPIKEIRKEKVEQITKKEQGFSRGLRRTIISKLDGEIDNEKDANKMDSNQAENNIPYEKQEL